ncbi:hypothetical protein EVAR_76947_1 [Eumeta japonica]|uniref:Uncharacterized protein n=1 Tax=Eumeta variegata TaxID=151549 RepID=A0A4C1SEV1_EUMVA|nr:hypothetical protein EVAR_76947_1 [Eumeta japonica]
MSLLRNIADEYCGATGRSSPCRCGHRSEAYKAFAHTAHFGHMLNTPYTSYTACRMPRRVTLLHTNGRLHRKVKTQLFKVIREMLMITYRQYAESYGLVKLMFRFCRNPS